MGDSEGRGRASIPLRDQGAWAGQYVAAARLITMRPVQAAPDGSRLGRLVRLVAQGELTVSVLERLPLEQAAAALAQARHGAHGSAIVLWP
jgi:NADPH:quinone reductase-like Zn-dependent oxidoreductase